MSFNGIKIGFLTDIHISEYTDEVFINESIEKLLEHTPDIIILGGDYTWTADTLKLGLKKREQKLIILYEKLTPLLKKLTAPLGVFAVIGNHDRRDSERICKESFSKIDTIKMLINESIQIKKNNEEISIFGVDDYLTGDPLFKIPPHPFEILVTHNSDYISALEKINQFNFPLTLAGHTHGGQINFPIIGNLITPLQDLRFMQGLVQVKDNYVYTSRGIGVVGVPIRIAAPPEVTIVELLKT